jgi:hypothetical protein
MVMNQRYQKDAPSLKPVINPAGWGLIAGLSLLSIYFLILAFANSFAHSIEQFKEMWYWITILVFGFGTQAGLYSYIRREVKAKKQSGAATTSIAAAGGISTTSMVACCAHHVTDVLPILGISAAVIFLNQFQNLFLTLGVLSNFIGLFLMLRIIQKHGLFQKEQKIFSTIMKLNMNESFYAVSTVSALIFLATLYKSI